MTLRPTEVGHQCYHQRKDTEGHELWEDLTFVERYRRGQRRGRDLRMGEGVVLSLQRRGEGGARGLCKGLRSVISVLETTDF